MMLRIHFLNVGHGDCTIIEHPSGRITMVDVNNGKDLGDNSQGEILKRQSTTLLAELLAESSLTPQARDSLLNRGGFFQTAGPGFLSGLMPNQSDSAFGMKGLLETDKKQGLREAGCKIGLTNPVDYFQREFPGHPVFRYIQTHPDLDHMRGLVAMREHGIEIVNFWDTEHSKPPEFKSRGDEAEWFAYQNLRNSSSNPRALRLSGR